MRNFLKQIAQRSFEDDVVSCVAGKIRKGTSFTSGQMPAHGSSDVVFSTG